MQPSARKLTGPSVSAVTLLATATLGGCCTLFNDCPPVQPPVVTTQDVITASVSPNGAFSDQWPAGTYYAWLETSSSGIATAASQCDPNLEQALAQFAKSLFKVDTSNIIVITVNIEVNGHRTAKDLPLLIMENSSSAGNGRTCRVSGKAISANPTKISPVFRADANQDFLVSFDVKVVDRTNVKTFNEVKNFIDTIASAAGAQVNTIGRLTSTLLTPVATAFDEATTSALTRTPKTNLFATLKKQKSADPTAYDLVTFDISKYIDPKDNFKLNNSLLNVNLNYKRSVVADKKADGSIDWPTEASQALAFRPLKLQNNTYNQYLDAVSVPNFNPTFLKPGDGATVSASQMVTACGDLKKDLDDIGLTPDDALVVRYAALREKTSYFTLRDTWTHACLTGHYLAKSSQIAQDGETEHLVKLNARYTAPGYVDSSLWPKVIRENISELRKAAQDGRNSDKFDPKFNIVIDDTNIVPLNIVGSGRAAGDLFVKEGDDAKDMLKKVAYGGVCAQVLDYYLYPQSIKELALFGRYRGPNVDGFGKYRDDQGIVLPLVAEWSANGKIASIRVTTVETIKNDYTNSSNWPVTGADNCTKIVFTAAPVAQDPAAPVTQGPPAPAAQGPAAPLAQDPAAPVTQGPPAPAAQGPAAPLAQDPAARQ